MRKLIKLEWKRNKIRTYIIASMIIAVVMLSFLYLFAYIPMLEPNDKDMAIFSGYNNLIPLFGVFNMAIFCILSAVMYSKFIIEDYSGKRPILLFSYPVSRKKVMLAKLIMVYLFTIIAMFISNLAIFSVFGITERFIHLVSEKFTLSVLFKAAEVTFIMSFIAANIGIVAVGIGFIKKSIPTTIVSAMLIASLICNIVVNITSTRITMYLFAIVMVSIGILFSMILIKKVDVMEIE